jgi:hypothetical protein
MKNFLVLLLPLTLTGAALGQEAPPLTAPQLPVAPVAQAIKTPRFEADTSQVPELQPWGRAAEALCQVWYERVVQILESDDSVRPLPPVVKIIFEKDMKGVAHVLGPKMHIAAHWVKSRPDDFGMVAHELVHLVQRYQPGQPGWIVEGMADYVRARHFEPNIKTPRINFEKAKYTDAYKTTASFFIWLEAKYDARIVPKLHAAMRARNYKDELFQEWTGKDLPTLWNEFAQESAPPPAPVEPAKTEPVP